ncbi:MAG: threonine--tRNA ligase, partial [Thermoplasmata archaeon]|nr:threonine--tRNA ligase [Thermoplasmata archaeon]
MRLLFIHSDHLEYESRETVGDIAEPIEGEHVHRFDECLVVFMTVEKEDPDHGEGLVKRVADEIAGVMEQVGAPRIVLYPWAHLSSDLATASESVPLLKEIELELLSRDLMVDRAAFGWYKSFTLNCKGHPLAELARHISFKPVGEMGVSKAVLDEEKVRSTFHVLTPEGELFEADSFNFG